VPLPGYAAAFVSIQYLSLLSKKHIISRHNGTVTLRLSHFYIIDRYKSTCSKIFYYWIYYPNHSFVKKYKHYKLRVSCRMISVNNSYEVVLSYRKMTSCLQELCPFNKLMDIKMNIWQIEEENTFRYYCGDKLTRNLRKPQNRTCDLDCIITKVTCVQTRNNVCDNNGRKNNSTVDRITSNGQSARLSPTYTNIADRIPL